MTDTYPESNDIPTTPYAAGYESPDGGYTDEPGDTGDVDDGMLEAEADGYDVDDEADEALAMDENDENLGEPEQFRSPFTIIDREPETVPPFDYRKDLSRYTFMEGSTPNPGTTRETIADTTAEMIRRAREEFPTDGQVDLTRSERSIVAAVQLGVRAIGKELEIPLDRRVLHEKDHRAYQDKPLFDEATARLYFNPGEKAVHHRGAGVLWLRPAMGSPAETLAAIGEAEAYELQALRVAMGTPKEGMASGYSAVGDTESSALDIIAAKITSARIQRTAGNPEPILSGSLAAFGHAAVLEVAEKQGLHPHNVTNMILRGAFNSQFTKLNLEMLNETLGEARANHLWSLSPDLHGQEAVDTAQKLGLPKAAELLRQERAGGGMAAFRWNRA